MTPVALLTMPRCTVETTAELAVPVPTRTPKAVLGWKIPSGLALAWIVPELMMTPASVVAAPEIWMPAAVGFEDAAMVPALTTLPCGLGVCVIRMPVITPALVKGSTGSVTGAAFPLGPNAPKTSTEQVASNARREADTSAPPVTTLAHEDTCHRRLRFARLAQPEPTG